MTKDYKINVEEEKLGLDFIVSLNPIRYNFDALAFQKEVRPFENKIEGYKLENYNFAKDNGSKYVGLKVEDVALVDKEFISTVKLANKEEMYILNYIDLLMPLVNAVKTLKLELEELKNAINSKDVQPKMMIKGLNTEMVTATKAKSARKRTVKNLI